jgi:hypothetical protein
MDKIIYMDEIDAQTNHTMWMKLLMDEADKKKVAKESEFSRQLASSNVLTWLKLTN